MAPDLLCDRIETVTIISDGSQIAACAMPILPEGSGEMTNEPN
jgi:hypothetical protein